MAEDRARSFIERYMIARASTFRTGAQEIEDMHACTLMAKSAYRHIANVAREAEPAPFVEAAQQGITGPIGSIGQAGVANTPIHTLRSDLVVFPAPSLASPSLESASKEAWLAAGARAIRDALATIAKTGRNIPANLMEAAKEVFTNGKTP